MGPKARKEKGKKYENYISDLIHTILLSKNENYRSLYEAVENDNLKPRRDYSSGNFVNSDGDIDLGVAKKFFPFSIECKHWAKLDITLNAIFKRKFSDLIKIWSEQALPKSIKTGLKPLVIFKANRTDDYVFYDKDRVQLIPINNFIKVDQWIICLFTEFLFTVDKRITEKLSPFNS